MAYVIRKLGDDTDEENLKQYCMKFKSFCERKVFEVPPTAFKSGRDDTKKKKFVILVTKDIVETLNDVKVSQRKIATILGVKSSALELHVIDKASIILVFSVPSWVAQQLFPLDTSTHEQLMSGGFTLLLPEHQLQKSQMGVGQS